MGIDRVMLKGGGRLRNIAFISYTVCMVWGTVWMGKPRSTANVLQARTSTPMHYHAPTMHSMFWENSTKCIIIKGRKPNVPTVLNFKVCNMCRRKSVIWHFKLGQCVMDLLQCIRIHTYIYTYTHRDPGDQRNLFCYTQSIYIYTVYICIPLPVPGRTANK